MPHFDKQTDFCECVQFADDTEGSVCFKCNKTIPPLCECGMPNRESINSNWCLNCKKQIRAKIRTKADEFFCKCVYPRVHDNEPWFCLDCQLDVKGTLPLVKEAGRKDDEEKDPWDLLPTLAVRQVVKVLQHGKKKYHAWNWLKGLEFSRLYSGVHRHLTAWFEGEDNDPESNLSHLAHACCGILFLLTLHILGRKDLDDRPKYTQSNP
jgi:hypothetical protein